MFLYYVFGEHWLVSKEDSMIRMVFGIAVAALLFAAGSAVSQAAPIAPLPAGIASGAGNVTPVHWHHHCWWRHHHRHCD